MHLPSAGMSRFRFNGFACASQPCEGHPEVSVNITRDPSGARVGVGLGFFAEKSFRSAALSPIPARTTGIRT